MDLNKLNLYHTALGKFMTSYSDVERLLIITLWTTAGIGIETGQALMPSIRTDEAITKLRKLYDARGTPLSAELDRALDHLADINTTRNNIIHWGARPTLSGAFEVKNLLRPVSTNPVSYEVTPDTLDAMTDDLQVIGGALAIAIFPNFTSAPKEIIDVFREAALRPWRYTPAQRASKAPPTPTPKGTQTQQRPLKP